MSKEEKNFHKAASDHADSVELIKRSIQKTADQAQINREISIAMLSEMTGKIKATHFFKEQATFFDLLLLKQIKDAKEYRDQLGMTWDDFCESIGLKRRTVDDQLQDLQPFRLEFLAAFRQFSGVDMSKIKYLGMEVIGGSASITGNMITYNGETIPVDQEHAEEIAALIETLEENHKKEVEDATAKIRQKDKLLKDKEAVLNKQEKEIMRLERTVEKSELTEEEQEGVDLLIQCQKDFLTSLSDIKKKIEPHKAPEVVLKQLYYLYIFIAKEVMDERMALHAAYANAEAAPWEITEEELPPMDQMIDNTPMTAGKGMGKKVAAKMEERKGKGKKK